VMLAAALLLAVGTSAVLAKQITLRMKGGGFQVQGDLKAFDSTKYTIFSNTLGTMSLDASRFDCLGDNCPSGSLAAPVEVAALVSGSTGNVQIAGSNTIGNQLMPSLIQSYAARNNFTTTKIVGENPLDVTFKIADASNREVAEISLARYGSSTSFRALLDGAAQIGMSSRPIKDKEVASLSGVGLGDMRAPTHEHIIGLDGLLIITSEENPAVALPLDKVAQIFSGQITDWGQLGLPPGKINVYAPSSDSGTFDTFKSLVLKPNKVKLVDNAKRTPNHSEQSDLVARDPLGIGVVGIAYQRNAKALNIETSCGLISKPTRFSMKTEEYPLTRRLYLYTAGQPEDSLARGLLEFATSKDAQPIVDASDFIDQTPVGLPFIDQSPRIAFALNATAEDFDMPLMRDMISTLKDAERMSATLRFQTGVSKLDNKSLADIKRLRNILSQPTYKGKTIMIVGYADSVGAFSLNRDLSRQRAKAVQTALLAEDKDKLAGLKVATYAFSELAPVACNDAENGRRFNRRVEIWVGE
ncbi:MAG: phosphate ABC transporter substrate-binding/OmpA family protein, partial [Pseudomonadota bacterium]